MTNKGIKQRLVIKLNVVTGGFFYIYKWNHKLLNLNK